MGDRYVRGLLGPWLPARLVLPAGLLITALIGYLDYITGDYSLLIFYLIPVAFASWCGGKWQGCLIAIVAGGTRIMADTADVSSITLLHYWNSSQECLFLVVTAILINILRQVLERDG